MGKEVFTLCSLLRPRFCFCFLCLQNYKIGGIACWEEQRVAMLQYKELTLASAASTNIENEHVKRTLENANTRDRIAQIFLLTSVAGRRLT